MAKIAVETLSLRRGGTARAASSAAIVSSVTRAL
jgi:hypothetical protein